MNQQRPDGGTIFPGTVNRTAAAGVPQVTLAVEHYNRMVRLLEHNVPVKVELDVTRAVPRQHQGLQHRRRDSRDRPRERGRHARRAFRLAFRSRPARPTTRPASTAMLEALRIIKTLGLKPRRTIRVALWGGEEQGLLGSRAYVLAHFADPQTMALKPEHAKLAAYFNLDNGTGKIRGIWMQSNLAARPIFEQWIAPLKDLGVTILGPRNVASTDHSSFDAVGPARLPVRAGSPRVQLADAPLEHGHLRSRAAGRPDPAGDGRRRVRLQRRDARREAAAEGAAEAAAAAAAAAPAAAPRSHDQRPQINADHRRDTAAMHSVNRLISVSASRVSRTALAQAARRGSVVPQDGDGIDALGAPRRRPRGEHRHRRAPASRARRR